MGYMFDSAVMGASPIDEEQKPMPMTSNSTSTISGSTPHVDDPDNPPQYD
jgi:hypothetical protein